jgi:hypothetical protein
MSSSLRGHKPVERLRVLMGALALLGMLGSVVIIGEVLRHPDTRAGVPDEEPDHFDPRDEIDCPEPPPREGQERSPQGDTTTTVDVSSSDLYDCPQFFDGRRVRYRGEVVGALLHRDTGVWVQLNDDAYAEALGPLPAHRDYRGGNSGVGVLLPTRLTAQIDLVGGPQTRGDVVEIEGMFNRVDPSGEVAVIRAETAELTASGEALLDPLLTHRLVAAVLAILFAGGMVAAERVVARRR